MKQFFYSLTLASLLLNFSSCQKNDAKGPVADTPTESLAAQKATNYASSTPDETDGTIMAAQRLITNWTRGGGGSAFTDPNACTTCTLQYPDASNMPRSGAVFNESDELVASEPGPSTCTIGTQQVKLWYSDEHAMTLGVRRVVIKTSSGSTPTDYPFTAQTALPTTVLNPSVGTTMESGDQSGNDVAAGGGRPLWPALYITDITWDPFSRAGDWQQGGIGHSPNRVSGVWKGVTRTIDYTHNPALVTVTADADPSQKNGWNLGGGDAPPAGVVNDGFGCEVVWDVAALNLIPGHKYRILFMVHDGDQNKVGGDVGEACITIVAKENAHVHAPD